MSTSARVVERPFSAPYWWTSSLSWILSSNEVTTRRARLVLGWVTVSGFNFWCVTFISICHQPSRSTQPDHPFVGRHNEYQPKGGDALRLGSKDRYGYMATLIPRFDAISKFFWAWSSRDGLSSSVTGPLVASKTVWSHCYTRAIVERFWDTGLIIKRYINSPVYFLYSLEQSTIATLGSYGTRSCGDWKLIS